MRRRAEFSGKVLADSDPRTEVYAGIEEDERDIRSRKQPYHISINICSPCGGVGAMLTRGQIKKYKGVGRRDEPAVH